MVDDHETQRAEAVVERDDHDIAAAGKALAVVDAERRRADLERAAVDPHHHGALTVGGRSPHVEIEAIVAHVGYAHAGHDAVEWAATRLPRGMPEAVALTCVLPRVGWLRWLPTQGARRRGRVRDAQKRKNPVTGASDDRARGCFDKLVHT